MSDIYKLEDDVRWWKDELAMRRQKVIDAENSLRDKENELAREVEYQRNNDTTNR